MSCKKLIETSEPLVKFCRGCKQFLPRASYAPSSYTQKPYRRCRNCKSAEYKKYMSNMTDARYRAIKANELAWMHRNPERVAEYNRKICERRKLERRKVSQ